MDASNLRRAAQVITEADAILFSAGAGMGVDSGLPDFRGNQGFWNAYPPYAERGLSFIDMANPAWFERDPEFAWGFYGHRMNLYRATEPHAGFEILLEWAEGLSCEHFVFTSNVDGQHQKAGFAGRRVNECHGSIHHLQCTRSCTDSIWDAREVTVEVDAATMQARPPLPRCPECGALARPNVLMFGDWSWNPDRNTAQDAAYGRWLAGLSDARVAIIECGAGTGVPTVRIESERLLGQLEATLIRVNPREPAVPPGQISFAAGALETLTCIQQVMDGYEPVA